MTLDGTNDKLRTPHPIITSRPQKLAKRDRQDVGQLSKANQHSGIDGSPDGALDWDGAPRKRIRAFTGTAVLW